MGLFDFIKGQLVEIIEWRQENQDVIVQKFDDKNCDIKMGAKLIVRESQVAIFVNEGTLADVFMPGTHTLSTQNMPLLTVLKSWKYGFQSPFKCDVFFISTRQFRNQKWGTSNPIMMRDQDFGILRLRAFGMYSFQITKPDVFLRQIAGVRQQYLISDLTEQLRSKIVSGLSDAIAESKIPALDLAAQYEELSKLSRDKFNNELQNIGVLIADFIIENISLPESVEKAMDQRASMGALGDLNKYTQYQAAEAMRDAAQNTGGGGVVGMGVGMGVGANLGKIMTEAMAQNQQPQTQPQQQNVAPPMQTIACPQCGKLISADAKFCPECGNIARKVCPNCGAPASGKFCGECGQPV